MCTFSLTLPPRPSRSPQMPERSPPSTVPAEAPDAAQSHHRNGARAGLSGERHAEGALSRLTVERARGGVAMTMTAGSAAVSKTARRSSTSACLQGRDRAVDQGDDRRRARGGAAIMIQLTHLAAHAVGQGRLAPGRRLLASSRSGASRLSQEDRRLGHRQDNQGFCPMRPSA